MHPEIKQPTILLLGTKHWGSLGLVRWHHRYGRNIALGIIVKENFAVKPRR